MIDRISSTVLTGIRKGLDFFDSTATRIPGSITSNASTSSSSSTPPVTTTGNLSSALSEPEPSLEQNMVDLLLAKRFIQGQLGVIQTEDEMLAEVVNLGRRRTG